jgi:hypothetical protein
LLVKNKKYLYILVFGFIGLLFGSIITINQTPIEIYSLGFTYKTSDKSKLEPYFIKDTLIELQKGLLLRKYLETIDTTNPIIESNIKLYYKNPHNKKLSFQEIEEFVKPKYIKKIYFRLIEKKRRVNLIFYTLISGIFIGVLFVEIFMRKSDTPKKKAITTPI